jgi:hypothetical protein
LLVFGPSGLVDVDANRQTTAVLVESEDIWQRIAGIGIFAGNAYLLDAGTSEIWRYPGLSSGVGSAQRWLTPGLRADFSKVADMVIDGDVWLAAETGEVQQYRRGNSENFGLAEGVGKTTEWTAIDTSEGSDRIYLLDRKGMRVVAVTKEGGFVKQWVWEGISGVTDMAAVEAEAAVFLVSGSSIYRIELE